MFELPHSSPVEMPLLLTAYEDSYHSYAASLADVDARLADLSVREETIKNRVKNAKQTFQDLEEEMQEQKDAFENHLRSTRQRQIEVQERLVALQQRRERLAVYDTQRQALAAEDEAAATQEAYWQELLRSHQHALEALTRCRLGTLSPSKVDGPSTLLTQQFPPPPDQGDNSPRTKNYHGVVPRPPSFKRQQQRIDSTPPLHPRSQTSSPVPASRSLIECWPEAVAATRAGHAAALAALLCGCPEAVQCTDAQGNTLLHQACAVEPPSVEVVRCLLRHGAPLTVYNANGLTPLHVACLNPQDVTHAVKGAILAAGALVDQRSEFGETAAHLLASHDAFLPNLEYLIDHHHADLTCRALMAGEMRTPLGVAEFYGGAQTAGVRNRLRNASRQ